MHTEKEYKTSTGVSSSKAKERYAKVHTHIAQVRNIDSRHNTHYRRGKPYNNYVIRLPKQWADGLDLRNHDTFQWNIISYDPVILQLRKLEGDTA